MDDWQDFILNALFGTIYVIWRIIRWIISLPIKFAVDVARGAYGKAVEYFSVVVFLAILGILGYILHFFVR